MKNKSIWCAKKPRDFQYSCHRCKRETEKLRHESCMKPKFKNKENNQKRFGPTRSTWWKNGLISALHFSKLYFCDLKETRFGFRFNFPWFSALRNLFLFPAFNIARRIFRPTFYEKQLQAILGILLRLFNDLFFTTIWPLEQSWEELMRSFHFISYSLLLLVFFF